jgi:hypothetical protein
VLGRGKYRVLQSSEKKVSYGEGGLSYLLLHVYSPLFFTHLCPRRLSGLSY